MDWVWILRLPKESRHHSSDIHFGHDVHAGPELEVVVLSRVDRDLHRNPLDDLDVIAGGIFGRKQTEKRTGRSGNTVHAALVGSIVGIDKELDALPRPHRHELSLFEVCGDPDFLQRNDSEQLLARCDVHSNHHTLGHLSVHGSNYFRVTKVQFGLLERSALLLHNGQGRQGPRLSSSYLTWRRLRSAVA